MKHKMKAVTQAPENELGGVGGWIASLVVWCVAIGHVSCDCVRLTQSGRVEFAGGAHNFREAARAQGRMGLPQHIDRVSSLLLPAPESTLSYPPWSLLTRVVATSMQRLWIRKETATCILAGTER
jgi:hypothetical protein